MDERLNKSVPVIIGGKPNEEPVLRGRYRIVSIADRVSK